MATFTDDWINHVIAFDYGFYPVEPAKYEPSDNVFDNRWIRLARQFDGTNALILFNPFELEPDEP